MKKSLLALLLATSLAMGLFSGCSSSKKTASSSSESSSTTSGTSSVASAVSGTTSQSSQKAASHANSKSTGSTSTAMQVSPNTVLKLWCGGQWTGNDYQNLQTFVNNFNKAKPLGFTVQLTPKTDMEVSMTAALNVGQAPDMVIWDRFNTPTYAQQHFLYSISSLIKRDKVNTGIYNQEANNELIYNGQQYGLPMDVDMWGIYLNTDIMNSYNAKYPASKAVVPTDWNQLLDTAKKLTTKDSNGNIVVAGLNTTSIHEFYFNFLTSTGTSITNSQGALNFNTQQSKDTLQYLKTLSSAKVCQSGLDTQQSFANGMLSMILQPVYFSSYLKKNAPNIHYQFIAQPRYPNSGGVNGGMFGGFGIAIPDPQAAYRTAAWTQRMNLSWEFMKWWLYNSNNALAWSKQSNTISAITSLNGNSFYQTDATLKTAISSISKYKTRPQIPGYLMIENNVFNVEIPNYFNGSLTIDQTISALTNESQAIINQYK